MNGNSKTPLSDICVLVVEDNEVNQKVTAAMLQHFGIYPDMAENGQVAIEMAGTRRYNLILMDCQMPVKNGFETTEYIRELSNKPLVGFQTKYDVIIVAMTANASEGDVQACMDHGMNDFIAKPIELDVIADILNKWFG